MTDDGRTAVGDVSNGPNLPHASTWTAEGGLDFFGASDGTIPGVDNYSTAISGDGSTIFGRSTGAPDAGSFRYRGPGTFQRITFVGPWSSLTWGHSSFDGETACGTLAMPGQDAPTQAFRWTAAGGLQLLGYAGQPHGYQSFAEDLSADGNTVVGRSYDGSGDNTKAWIWTTTQGTHVLADLDSTGAGSRAFGVSSDGRIVVGASGYAVEAVFWRDEQLISIGKYAGSAACLATSVSDDGGVIVGGAWLDSYEAFVWTPAHGMELMGDYFRRLGIVVEGVRAYGGGDWRVCPDGRTFYGRDGDRAFIVTIPAPAGIAPLAMIAALAVRKRR